MTNPEISMTLEQAVDDVLGMLTGLDLSYDPTLDRFRNITRQLNRALRQNATEHEWSYYSATYNVGTAVEGAINYELNAARRPRIQNDDAVRLVDSDGIPVEWAYVLPRDALHKYRTRAGLWCSVTREWLTFSRPFGPNEVGLEIHLPVMREPTMFRLPDAAHEEVDADVLAQLVDFDYPDAVVQRAAWLYAQTDPIMQPRVQTLEAQYKDIMYQLIERDTQSTDTPYLNDFVVPVQNDINGGDNWHRPPLASEFRR